MCHIYSIVHSLDNKKQPRGWKSRGLNHTVVVINSYFRVTLVVGNIMTSIEKTLCPHRISWSTSTALQHTENALTQTHTACQSLTCSVASPLVHQRERGGVDRPRLRSTVPGLPIAPRHPEPPLEHQGVHARVQPVRGEAHCAVGRGLASRTLPAWRPVVRLGAQGGEAGEREEILSWGGRVRGGLRLRVVLSRRHLPQCVREWAMFPWVTLTSFPFPSAVNTHVLHVVTNAENMPTLAQAHASPPLSK